MDFLPKIVTDFILKTAISGEDFKHLTDDDKNIVENIISNIVDSYDTSDFGSFISGLIEMHKVYPKIYPEDFHAKFLDFLSDRNMWEWTFASMDKSPTKYDWEAAKYITLDLKERMINQEVFP